MNDRSQIRREMRARRRALTPSQHHRLSADLVRRVAASRAWRASTRLACVFANDGEPDLTDLVRRSWRAGKRCYMPVLDGLRSDRMLFAPYTPTSTLRTNRYGIPEPVCPRRKLIAGRKLDLVLTPLVAFDMQGNRLGMGGGYYDRSFAFLRRRRNWRRPRLLGIAYQFQCVPQLPSEPWDVPLAGVVTEAGLHVFPPR